MNRLPADRVLVIRFHAIGDTAITLPLASALAQHSPEIATDYLTTASAAPLVRALGCFREVHLFPACRTPLERFRAVVSVARTLRSREYTTVLDLQGNWASRMLRTLLRPAVWSEFDRFAPIPAGLRVRNAFASASFGNLESPISLPVRQQLCSRAEQILSDAGWDGKRRLAILNPAGLWKSRQWPDPYFAALAGMLTNLLNCEILFVGTDRISGRVRAIQDRLGSAAIDLSGRTTLEEAFGILQHASLMVSEDSGLMHMAWVSGVRTIALFGSTRHDWASPLGPHTRQFHSGDLPCSACMSPQCHYDDVHCLTRVTPVTVFHAARELVDSSMTGRA